MSYKTNSHYQTTDKVLVVVLSLGLDRQEVEEGIYIVQEILR